MRPSAELIHAWDWAREHAVIQTAAEIRSLEKGEDPYPLWGRPWDQQDPDKSTRGGAPYLIRERQGQLRVLEIGTHIDPREEQDKRPSDIFVATTLYDTRRNPDGTLDQEKIKEDERRGFFLIPGSIGVPETWETVDSVMTRLFTEGMLEGKGFNYIRIMLGDGWDNLPLDYDSKGLTPEIVKAFETWLAKQIRLRRSQETTLVSDKLDLGIPTESFWRKIGPYESLHDIDFIVLAYY